MSLLHYYYNSGNVIAHGRERRGGHHMVLKKEGNRIETEN